MSDLLMPAAILFGLLSIGVGIREGLFRIAEILNLRWR